MSKLRSLAITFLCALALPCLFLLGHLWVEMGMNDDWSYIRSAQVFAGTGHIVFNGWSTALLGWQLFAAAPFLHLFGTSFTAPRLAVLLTAALCTALFHRILLRCDVREPWAALGALTLALSPVFLPLSVSFMSDISGLFALLLSLFFCLRALRAGTGACRHPLARAGVRRQRPRRHRPPDCLARASGHRTLCPMALSTPATGRPCRRRPLARLRRLGRPCSALAGASAFHGRRVAPAQPHERPHSFSARHGPRDGRP